MFNEKETPDAGSGVTTVGQSVSRVLSDWADAIRNLDPASRRPALGDHLSRPARRREALAAYPRLKGSEQVPAEGSASPLLGLAPEGGCLAAAIAAGAGGLLHHLFTLASGRTSQR